MSRPPEGRFYIALTFAKQKVMNNKLTISLMAVLAFCGCQKKELIDYTSESKVFTATIEDGITDSTKTFLSGITLPATQTYAVESFGNGTFPMVAVTSSTSDMNLKFKNVLGGLKLQLKGTAIITSIQVTGNNDEILCGSASVNAVQGNTPSIKMTDASAKTVTLDCGTGVQLNNITATSFVIALPPMTMGGGFTVVVSDTEGKEMEIKTTFVLVPIIVSKFLLLRQTFVLKKSLLVT